ncbi:MAG: shikimate dehydrogenase [Verrucomicrobiales bacterium]|nr:shikimate dehydrogenase [Verrucomicrobiales bacterium]
MSTSKDVYTFADLCDWSQSTRDLQPPAKLSVFGDPIAHSRSPQMHNPALLAAGIDAQYVRLHVQPDQLGDALQQLKEQNFTGTNLTIPHKAAAIEHMDDIDETARRIGAVNTVLVEDQKLIGFNSDAPGFARAIREEFSVDLRDLRILIIGAGGGAGRAVAVQAAMDRCERLVLANRTTDKAEALAAELSPFFKEDRVSGPMARLEAISLDEAALEAQMDNIDLIVNATSLGMKRGDPEALPSALIQPHHFIYDMVYSPARTHLIAQAENAGARAANGLSMLLHQGAISFEYWFNREAPLEAMRKGIQDSFLPS